MKLFVRDFLMNRKLERNGIYLEYKSFFNIINVVTVTFDQLNIC